MSHTPGPWIIQDGDIWDMLPSDEPGIPLFRMPGNRSWGRRLSGDEYSANVMLAASAPDLLEALRAMVTLTETDDEFNAPGTDAYTTLHVARAAIAKAEGRSPA